MASEIVDLLPWDDLAITRKNKKSLESQNQRVVIDFNCFYIVLIAHIALGFSSKQKELIDKAKTICECLIASEGTDLKLEETFCLFLLGQGNEAMVVEKLQKLELNSNSAARNPISGKEVKHTGGANQTLEMWLKDAVLAVFPDSRDCPPSLANFFGGERRTSLSKKSKVAPQNLPILTVKQLAPTDLQSPLILGKTGSGSSASASSVQLKRNLGMHHDKVWNGWVARGVLVGRITFVAVLGCIVFASLSLVPAYIKGNGLSGRLKKFLVTFMKQVRTCSDAENPQISYLSSSTAVFRRLMSIEEAEDL
ncbi:plastid division protein CDP1 chloroplastic [Prunus yedoensis var. nudiflora]|uniref:Plastid division protein CDP1 chloroplastic n=1 Tax=Prunus yedoensis var. nudiflora TaxID=2094558 RepID=A0A314ZFX6_PRUYE|nr:plastid division protein CDP1 chloroplastic [Prunus yedoensis var. nudiflora]